MGVLMAFLKMEANFSMASNCSLPKGANGAAGAGFFRASVNSTAARMALSAEDSLGMGVVSWKKSTVSQVRSA